MIVKYINLSAILWCVFLSSLEGRSLFFSVGKDSGGALVNGFPVGNTWFQLESNVTFKLEPEHLIKGSNKVELVLMTSSAGGHYVYQMKNDDLELVHDVRVTTQPNLEADSFQVIVDWIQPKQSREIFSCNAGEKMIAQLVPAQKKEDADRGVNKVSLSFFDVDEGVQGMVVLELDFTSEVGGSENPPWLKAEKFTQGDLASIQKTATDYINFLSNKKYEFITPICDEKWKWEALCYGQKYEDRAEITQRTRESFRVFEPVSVSVKKVDRFPLTQVVRVSGSQLGILINEQRLFLELYFMKIGNHWKIAL